MAKQVILRLKSLITDALNPPTVIDLVSQTALPISTDVGVNPSQENYVMLVKKETWPTEAPNGWQEVLRYKIDMDVVSTVNDSAMLYARTWLIPGVLGTPPAFDPTTHIPVGGIPLDTMTVTPANYTNVENGTSRELLNRQLILPGKCAYVCLQYSRTPLVPALPALPWMVRTVHDVLIVQNT